jgi:hypothetical protein
MVRPTQRGNLFVALATPSEPQCSAFGRTATISSRVRILLGDGRATTSLSMSVFPRGNEHTAKIWRTNQASTCVQNSRGRFVSFRETPRS